MKLTSTFVAVALPVMLTSSIMGVSADDETVKTGLSRAMMVSKMTFDAAGGIVAADLAFGPDNGWTNRLSFDVCVVGGGVAGVTAALQAQEAGAKTLLVERGFQVGGNMTTGGVSWPGLFHAWGRQVIDGCGWALVTNCVALSDGRLPDFTRDPGLAHTDHQVRVNAALWALLAEEALVRSGVDLRYHTEPMTAVWTNGCWTLTLAAGGQLRTVKAKVVIDATGNGSVAALCGARRMRDEKARQPGSFTYLLDPHADEAKLDWPLLEANAKRAVSEGRLEPTDIARGVRFLIHQCGVVKSGFAAGPDHGTTIANYVAGADNSTAESRMETNLRGRASLLRVLRFLRTQPGLERTTLEWASPEVGVRETWRVEGEYVMTGDDYASGRTFEDGVCYAFYPIDLHDAKKGIQPKHLKRGTVACVPRRALVAKGVHNVLVAGRCVSSDRAANSALRVQATCMATGQAAGTLAALAALRGVAPLDLPMPLVREALVRSGAIVPR